MIWLDSSFAVEWLSGTDRAKKVRLPQSPLGILPLQYMEVFVYFARQGAEILEVAAHLSALELFQPEKIHLQKASLLYVQARLKKSKASLADALLASVAQERDEKVVSFDRDFAFLGLKDKGGLWALPS